MFVRRIKELLNKDFARNVLMLISGTSIAQAIPIALSPVLTRLFSPDDFGTFGLFVAVSSILVVFSTGRYDLSIIEPRHEQDSKLLFSGSIVIAALFSIFLLIIILLLKNQITDLLDNEDIGNYLYFIPLSVFTVSCYNVIQIWFNRKKKYREMSLNRIANSSSTSLVSLLLGLLKFGRGGLIVGFIFGHVFAVLVVLRKILSEKFSLDKKRTIVLLKKYARYPRYLIPSTLAGELSVNGPTILLTTFFNTSVTGFFTFTNRVIAVPISLIGNAVGEVYRQKAAEDYHEYGNCKRIYFETLKRLFLIALIPSIVLFFFGEPLFGFVFGSDWLIAGKIAKYFSFIVFFQFLSTPLSYTIVFNKSQKMDLILQAFRCIFSIGAIYIGYLFSDYMLSIILYTIIFSIYYISHSLIQYRAAIGKSSLL